MHSEKNKSTLVSQQYIQDTVNWKGEKVSKCIVKVHNMPGLGYQIQFVMGAYLRLAM